MFEVLADVEPLAEFSRIADNAVFEKRHEHDAEQLVVGLKTLCEGVTAR